MLRTYDSDTARRAGWKLFHLGVAVTVLTLTAAVAPDIPEGILLIRTLVG